MSTTDLERTVPRRDWLVPPAAQKNGRARPSGGTDGRPSRGVANGGEPAGKDKPEDGDKPGEAEDGQGQQDRERGKQEREKEEQNKEEKEEKQKKDEEESKKRKGPVGILIFVVASIVVLAFTAVVLWIIFRPRPDVWTDDAYVMVHYTAVAPRVSGQIAAVPVENNQVVKAGDLLAELDPRDYRTALDTAEAQLGRDVAQAGDIQAQIDRQPALIDGAAAEVDAARARLGLAQADARRFGNLAATGAGTDQQRQQADSTLGQSQAAVRSAGAQLEAAKKQLDVLAKQKQAAEASAAADRAQVAQAKLNLEYTRVLAHVDGMVAERSVQVGNYVSPGTTLMVLAPLSQVYVQANYREVDLIHMRAGQRATVHVDAYDIDLDGVVNGVPAASGASFEPIAPNNATGNFTKIVQRLPVRIDVSPGQPLAKLLRVGFSVETTVHTGLEDVVAQQRVDPRAVTGR